MKEQVSILDFSPLNRLFFGCAYSRDYHCDSFADFRFVPPLPARKEDRSILYKEFFWLLISGLMILFMVFPAGEQMVEDYLGDKPYLHQ